MDLPGPSGRKRRIVKGSNEDFEQVITAWLAEEESDCSEIESCGDDFVPKQSDHDSNTETSESSESEVEEKCPSEANYYYGKNKYKWAKTSPNPAVRTAKHNIVLRLPSSKLTKEEKKEPFCIWKKIISQEILDEILLWTNKKLALFRERFSNQSRPELHDVDMTELSAFLGLLIYTAVFKSNHENVDFIFAADGTGVEIFRCVMSKKRFLNLLCCLRFDNGADREERRKTDKLAAISKIFNKFISNCQNLYNIGECATVDEMLIPFRGRSFFVLYMPNKPAKYGVKLMSLCEARTSYFYNGYIYCGRGSDGESLTAEEKKFLIPTQSVLRLSQPIHGTNRNVTCDNWFTSIELIDALKSRGLTCVGTLRKNKREIPKEFLETKKRAVGSSLYGFTGRTTLLSHVPKKRKTVLLASSMHHTQADDNITGKPEIIEYYNKTKGGVDDIDRKCSVYSCSRRTRRWPLVIFFRMLDISTVNSHIVYQSDGQQIMERGVFIKTLARTLVLHQMQRRVCNLRIPRELRTTLRRILGADMPILPQIPQDTEKTRKTCVTCPPKLKRKSSYSCSYCQRHVCLQCARFLCSECE